MGKNTSKKSVDDIKKTQSFKEINSAGNINKVIFPNTLQVGLSSDEFASTISGSIHHTRQGKSYLVAGDNITITSASNGQITIDASSGEAVGTVTEVSVGTGLDITTPTSTPYIQLDLSEIPTSTTDGDGDHFVVVNNSNVHKKLTKGSINLSGFNNDSGFVTENTMGSGFVLEDGAGTEVTITENKEVKFREGTGIEINWTDTSDGTDADPYDMQFAVDVSDFMSNGANNRIVTATGTDGMNAETNLTFDGSDLTVTGRILPGADDTYDLGSTTAAWQDLHLEGNINFTDDAEIDVASGQLTLDVAGDIILDADGDQIYFKAAGNERFRFNLDATPTIDVTGNFTIDGSGTMVLNADGGSLTIKDSTSTHFLFDMDNTELTIYDDVTSSDYLKFKVDTNGASTISTNDNDGTSGDLTFEVDGSITLDSLTGDINFVDNSNNTIFNFDLDNGRFRMRDDADTGDYFDIQVVPNGGVTLTTVDNAASNARLIANIDGYIDLNATGDITLDASGDIALSADGDQITMDDGQGNTRFTFNLDSTPELDINGNFTIDCGGDIVIDAGGGQIDFKDGGTNHFLFDMDNTSMSIYDDTNSNDYFRIQVAANGSTTLSTYDNDGTSGNMSLSADGSITLDSSGDITLDAAGDQIYFKDSGTTKLTYNIPQLGAVEVDVVGNYALTGSGGLTFDAGSDEIKFNGSGVTELTFELDSTPRIISPSPLGIYSTGDMTLDASTDIILDAAGTDIVFKSGGITKLTHNIPNAGAVEVDVVGAYIIDASGDITLDAGGDQIYFKDSGNTRITYNIGGSGVDPVGIETTGAYAITGSGIILNATDVVPQVVLKNNNTTRMTFNLDSTPEMDVAGNFTLDCTGDITLDADGGQIYFGDGGNNYLGFNVDGTNDSIDATGNLTLDVSGDITLDAGGADITFKSAGVTKLAYNIPQLSGVTAAVTGDYTLDVSGDITLDAGGNELYIADSGNTFARFTSAYNTTDGSGDKVGMFYIDSNDTIMGTGQRIMRIDSADQSMGTTNYWITFTQNGTLVGSIHSEVIYGTFTGNHPGVKLSGSLDYKLGSIVKSTGNVVHKSNSPNDISNAWVEFETTTSAKDKAVVGVYTGLWDEYNSFVSGSLHCYNAVGEGMLLVTDENGNIEVGDYICSSNREGHGMKQDSDSLKNFTVAKATESIDFSTIDVDSNLGFKSKLLACTYHCG